MMSNTCPLIPLVTHQGTEILVAYMSLELHGSPTVCHKWCPILFHSKFPLSLLFDSTLLSDESGHQYSLMELWTNQKHKYTNDTVWTVIMYNHKVPGHLTAISSMCWQLWTPIPRFEQLRREDSVPLHPTLSRKIPPLPLPKWALL